MNLRRDDFGEEVCASEYVFRFRDGSEKPVRIRVGHPYQDTTSVWACPIEMAGFERRYPDIRGEDSVQALSLAISQPGYEFRILLRRAARYSIVRAMPTHSTNCARFGDAKGGAAA